jgi:hypothetical protein
MAIVDFLGKYEEDVNARDFPLDETRAIRAVEKYLGVKFEIVEKEKVSRHQDEGALVPIRGGFLLQCGTHTYYGTDRLYNSEARKRFTICHELAHAFFYDCNQEIPKLRVDSVQEHTCDWVARELLLPKNLLAKELSQNDDDETSSIGFLRRCSRLTKVGMYPLSKRLTEDLDLLNQTMITFWRSKPRGRDPYVGISRVANRTLVPDSKMSANLKSQLAWYWRDRIYAKCWDEAISQVLVDGVPIRSKFIRVTGRRARSQEGRTITFRIECESLIDKLPERNLSEFMVPPPQLLSVQRF